MAVAQPLTAFSSRVSDATLEALSADAPRVRAIQAALDACAEESGPLRFEMARIVEPDGSEGRFYLMGERPSEALCGLFAVAEDAQTRFAAHLDLASDGALPHGEIRIERAEIGPAATEIPLDLFLRMLERDPQTTPAALETLFEHLGRAAQDGLITLSAEAIGLTDIGRALLDLGRKTLARQDEAMIAAIDRLAHDVADGRRTLGEALAALGAHLGLDLLSADPPPVPAEAATGADAIGPIDIAPFAPLFEAARDVPEALRPAVLTLALQRALEEWGLPRDEAQDRVAHDVRALRAIDASASHGAPAFAEAARVVEANGVLDAVPLVAAAAGPDLCALLAGPRRVNDLYLAEAGKPARVSKPDEAPIATGHARRRGLFERLVSALRRHVRLAASPRSRTVP
jgi:hypothetical protein